VTNPAFWRNPKSFGLQQPWRYSPVCACGSPGRRNPRHPRTHAGGRSPSTLRGVEAHDAHSPPISSPTDHFSIPRSFSSAPDQSPSCLPLAARCRPRTTPSEVHLRRRRLRLGRVAGRPCPVGGLLGLDETKKGTNLVPITHPSIYSDPERQAQKGWRRPDRSRRWTPLAGRPFPALPTRPPPALYLTWEVVCVARSPQLQTS
jgi:hypothetical protein